MRGQCRCWNCKFKRKDWYCKKLKRKVSNDMISCVCLDYTKKED